MWFTRLRSEKFSPPSIKWLVFKKPWLSYIYCYFNNINQLQFCSDLTSNMGLRRTLHSAKAKGFLSTTALRKIVTKDTVLSWCDSDKASAEYKLRNCLPGMIVPSSIKLFAVLVYANLANYILAFITHEDDPINDDIFPASNETRLFFNRGDERQLFLRTQWEIAPLFHTHVHLEPPKDIQIGKLFIRMNDKSLANSGIALIHEIKIEPGHLEGTSPNMVRNSVLCSS